MFQDLRFATRQLVKSPGFAITAMLVLALGMAASVAIFAFVDAALVAPLPYANPAPLLPSYLPARKAAAVNPVEALRAE